MRSRNQKLQKKMFALVEQYIKDTQTVEQICKENNLPSSKFKYWKGVYYKTSAKRKRSSPGQRNVNKLSSRFYRLPMIILN